METWLVIVLALLVLVYVAIRKRNSSRTVQTAERPRVAQRSTPYHSVSIQIQSGACRAAQEIRGRRFLSDEAPLLPLPGCTSVQCNCTFVHYADRRGRQDRRGELPRGSGPAGETGEFEAERRSLRERRHEDDDGL
jgi:hypothetical protein